MRDSISVFVNTSDGFEDCWTPFFLLYSEYAGVLRNAPIYLNTERATFHYEGLSITSTHTWPVNELQRPTWSECLVRGLRAICEPYLLYMHEDYFLQQPVNEPIINDALDIIENDPTVGVIYLNRYGPQFQNSKRYSANFVEIQRPAKYMISTQSAIWRKDFLLSHVFPWENGWMFEKFGDVRALRSELKLLSVASELMETQPVVDYIYTGVIKGRWKVECVELFKQHGIEIDFGRRGFYREMGRLKSRMEVFKKLTGEPKSTLRSLMSLVRR